jgi:MscS family membrane protein
LIESALNTPGVLKDPSPKVYIKDLGNFSVNLLMHVWVSDYKMIWEVPDQIYRATLKRFAAESIEIPYPVTSVILNRPQEPQGIVVAEALTPAVRR